MQSNNPNTQGQAPMQLFNSQSASHMTHMPSTTNPYEKCEIQFQLPNAMIWQIKFILSSLSSKKSLPLVTTELNALSEQFGKDFRKYLLKELIEQIDLKDPTKASKDKTESVKITLLNQELTTASQLPEFLSYFGEIIISVYGQDAPNKSQEFIQELTKRLKLNSQSQILVTLSLLESIQDDVAYTEIIKIFRQKLIDFHVNGKPEQLPEYAIHRILYLFDTNVDLKNDALLKEPKQFIIETNASRFTQFTALRASLGQDVAQANCHSDLPSYNLLKDGGGLEHLEFVNQVLQPWEVLIDIGHSSSYMYDFLVKTLSEFKNIDEKVMAITIVQLSIHNQGKDDQISKIIYNSFESNKLGQSNSLKKEPADKKTAMSWSVENLARAFRELYSSLNWNKVFDCFGEICDDEMDLGFSGLDKNQFSTLLQLFNKSKPQNFMFPLNNLLQQRWASPNLQITFISNCIQQFVAKKEKNIQFGKLKNKAASVSDLQDIKETTEMIEVWQSVDLVERLIILSSEYGQFQKIRKILEYPIKQLPEYLLFSVSMAKPSCGQVMLDEILSILMPVFLGNHVNSSIVLGNLFTLNQPLFIRGICELCKHDQRLMNLSRVLDITQEVRESLIKIVYCEDYNFAVNLGILAGKRDYLHYDQWVKSRIKDVGTPFISALITYIHDNIINPVNEFITKNQDMAETNPEQFENHKNSILERSHLSKEKLIITIDHLQNNQLRQQENVQRESLTQIQELVVKNQELFPQHYEPGQNSEEIEAAANEHFQKVFSAEDSEVDRRIEELIFTMQNFKESQIVKEQEIYACMLHGLFDEYRFLHRYPPQYLTKIAKLFGAIIKNNLLDRVLQDIALKFVFEAFRRDNRRQKFGIIVIKSFFQMLPTFPKFLEDIYNIRQSIQNSDPQMMQDIERLYTEMINQPQQPEERNQDNDTDNAATNDSDGGEAQAIPNIIAQAEQHIAEENKYQDDISISSAISISTDKSKKSKKEAKGTLKEKQANTKGQKTVTNKTAAPNGATKDFVPTAQTKVFIPNKDTTKTEQANKIEPSSLVDHMNVPPADQATSISPQVARNTSNNTILPGGGSLNVQSAAFQRPTSNPNIIPKIEQKQINIAAKEFMPSKPESQQPRVLVDKRQFQELLDYHKIINVKIQTAIENGGKLRLEDLIEDSSIRVNNEYVEDQIRIICNNTGKGNFKQKVEDLKKFVIKRKPEMDSQGNEIFDEKSKDAEEHLRWFIQYLLIKRINLQSSSLMGIYVDMIREIHGSINAYGMVKHNVIAQTLNQIKTIFKKCMLIDEDEFSKVTNAQNGTIVLGNYIASLGSFIGTLTLAKNEPLRTSHLDLKQILIESSQVKNRKIAIVFVCRILKESENSRVFNLRNPWVITMLQILKEMPIGNDFNLEIESLFKTLKVQNNNIEIKPNGILESLQKPINLVVPVIRKELEFLQKRMKLILPAHATPQVTSVQEPKQASPEQPQEDNGWEQLRQQMTQNSQKVTVSSDLLLYLQGFKNFNEKKVRKLMSIAVDNSIVEILPPVVDRSVTIALITTRELVLKDFAYDGNFDKVLMAADASVQSLAGSLALVTCREPLRMSLNTNLKKTFEHHFKNELGVEIIKCQNLNFNNDESGNITEMQNIRDQEQVDNNGFHISISEEKINDIAVLSSRENLELGCSLIKKKVIEKALRKVREDPQINQAVERRQRSAELGIRQFRDETIVTQFQELPQQLQPNQNGLSQAQFMVYQDFHKLNGEGIGSVDAPPLNINPVPRSLTQILELIEQEGLTENNENLMMIKIKDMNQQDQSQEDKQKDKEKLYTYVQKKFKDACKDFDSRNAQAMEQTFQMLSIVVTNYTVENFSGQLLKVFLQLNDVSIFNNLELNIILMDKRIISITEWDRQIANYFKEEAAKLPQQELKFFANILKTGIVEKKILTKEQLPQLISVISSMTSDSNIGKFCQYTIDSLQGAKALQGEAAWKEKFIKWVAVTNLDDKDSKEAQCSQFFSDLKSMGIDDNTPMLFNFCKIMVKTSIDRALYYDDELKDKRPADRLDFRYIDSFVKCLLVLLRQTTFQFNLTKHEIMTKIFMFIGEVLNEDHNTNKAEFNQRPYYRVLMTLLTAINHGYCFNQKTQLLVLYSMADLFKNLSPQKYPGFCFAWLELISHQSFMPLFLKQNANQGGQNVRQQPYYGQDNHQKRFKYNELVVQILNFLKSNMFSGQAVAPAIQAFYHATLRVISVVKQDYPDFLSDFHFNLVNSLPDHCIQLRNIILSACPAHVNQPDPFIKNLKIDKLTEIKQPPRIKSNYDNYLSLMSLREDLENLTRTRRHPEQQQQLIAEVCSKMEQSEEIVNGRTRINSNVISAVVLFIAHQAQASEPAIETRETFKLIVHQLNDETRLCFLNAIVNELRFPNTHTVNCTCIILYIFDQAQKEIIQEQISSIFLERLQCQGSYPWGLRISFRELIQNPKYKFMEKQYIVDHRDAVNNLFQQPQLRPYLEMSQHSHQQPVAQQ